MNTEAQLTLIDRAYMLPLDLTTQVSRVPGIDAPCTCGWPECGWPYCDWKKPTTEGEE